MKELWCYNDQVLVECPVTELGAVVNRKNLIVTVLVGALLLGNVSELAGDVLQIICLMGTVFDIKIIFSPSLKLCGLVGGDAR